MNNESYISEKMLVWILLLFLASANSQEWPLPQFTQDSTESTPRLPWNRYDDSNWDQNAGGFGFRNPLGQNENVIIKQS